MIAFRAPTRDELLEQAFFGYLHDVMPGYVARRVGDVIESLPRQPCRSDCPACREHQDPGDEDVQRPRAMTLLEVKDALAAGARERQAAERTLKRSPRR